MPELLVSHWLWKAVFLFSAWLIGVPPILLVIAIIAGVVYRPVPYRCTLCGVYPTDESHSNACRLLCATHYLTACDAAGLFRVIWYSYLRSQLKQVSKLSLCAEQVNLHQAARKYKKDWIHYLSTSRSMEKRPIIPLTKPRYVAFDILLLPYW